MLRRLEAQRLGEIAFDAADRAARHVLDLAAPRAYGVVVMLRRAEKVRAFASPSRSRRGRPDSLQRFERPVDRRKSDTAAFSRQPLVKLFRRRVSLDGRELFDDREPLFRHSKRSARERGAHGGSRRFFGHRARTVARRDATTADSSERRRGEKSIARKKNAVAVRTIVAPDAASR